MASSLPRYAAPRHGYCGNAITAEAASAFACSCPTRKPYDIRGSVQPPTELKPLESPIYRAAKTRDVAMGCTLHSRPYFFGSLVLALADAICFAIDFRTLTGHAPVAYEP